MKKTLLYRWFNIGAIPANIRPVLESEGIVVADEGMGGWFITKNVRGPQKRFIRRAERFSGCLAVTQKRIISYTFRRRQIHIWVDDPRISKLYVEPPRQEMVCISFESGHFRTDWAGIIEFRFKTDQAGRFFEALTAAGVSPGKAGKAGAEADAGPV